MRVRRLRIEAFGRIRDLDTGPEPLPDVVVALGPNEAGKSTLARFLTTLLYGFYPASRDRNPYTPWGEGDAQGSGVLHLDGGGCVEVERRLRSTPTGSLRSGDTEDDLRNRTLPWVDHVPLKVFEEVFSVSLADLAGLDATTWEEIQDRLIGSMGASDLRPARTVADELEAEAGELWRPSRRGNQRIRDLRAESRALRERRRDAADADRRLREAVRQRDEARRLLKEAREERQRRKLAVARVERLEPVRRALRRIDDLRREAGDTDDLEGLPAEPDAALRRLDDDVRARAEAVADARSAGRDPQAAVDAYTDDARRLVGRRRDIEDHLGRAAGVAPQRARIGALLQELSDLDRRLETTAADVLATPWSEVPAGPLHALPVSELRSRLRDLTRAREDRRVAESALGRATAVPVPEAPGPPRTAAAALLALGAILLAAGGVSGVPAATVAGVAALAAGAALLAAAARPTAPRPAPGETPEERALAEARSTEADARTGVESLLREIPVAPAALDEADAALAASLERLQELVRDRQERERALAGLQEDVARVDRDGRGLAALFGHDPDADPGALTDLLERELRRAASLAEAAGAAERELDRLRRQEARAETARAEAAEARDRLRTRLAVHGDGDPERGVDVVGRRRRAATRAAEARADLERAHPDLDDLMARIERAEAAGEPWTLDDEELARIKADVESLTEEIEGLVQRAEAMDAEVGRLEERETADSVDGAIATLDEEETRLLRQRDRKWVLAQLIRTADRRFREQHQPDVMRRAGRHLAHLTGGRYDRILADETRDDGPFHLRGPSLADPIPLAPPLSTGTLEQAYLALRLAIVDHLDEGQERLPLVLDEVLVNWDEARRSRGMDALAAVAETRQVFLFTCHPEMADAMASRGARVLTIGSGT
ncbi:MAG: AAA family ATPase [Longimicrobiales bacterium]